jgi:hypothetical protein
MDWKCDKNRVDSKMEVVIVGVENRYKLAYDLKQRVITNIRFKQGDIDSSVIEVTLVDNGLAVDITGEIIEFRFMKPDRTVVYQDFTMGVSILDGPTGKIECVLKSNTLAAVGVEKCEIHRAKDGKELTTPSFDFVVESSIGGDGILSTNYISSIEQELIKMESAENIRQINEAARQNGEIERDTAEVSRASNETARAISENSRMINEFARENDEDTRNTNEIDRVSAEDIRVAQEELRKTTESSRVTAESNRLVAESARVTVETARAAAETERVTQENARKTAETSRASAETNRINAETNRANAETDRINAETGRATAETDRVTQFNVIKNGATLFDVLPITTVRNSIELNPLGTYNYVSGNTVTANSLTTMESGQTDLNYAVTLQVSNEKVYSKTSYGFEVDKMIRDIMLTQ